VSPDKIDVVFLQGLPGALGRKQRQDVGETGKKYQGKLQPQAIMQIAGCVGLSEEKSANHQSPVDPLQKLPLKKVKFRHGYTTHFGVEAVCTERIAETFAGNHDRCNDESVARKRREGEKRYSGANLIDVIQCD
jgi:hypothetical protein